MSEPLDLLPCPFCGGPARLCELVQIVGSPKEYSVYCQNCVLSYPTAKLKPSAAVAGWNRRAPSPVGTPKFHRIHLKSGEHHAELMIENIEILRAIAPESLVENKLNMLFDYHVQRLAKLQAVGTAPLREALDLRNQFTASLHNWLTLEHVTDIMRDFDKIFQPIHLREAISHQISMGHVASETLGEIADRILALLPRSAPTLKGAPADEPR